jgi:hypothetical protein
LISKYLLFNRYLIYLFDYNRFINEVISLILTFTYVRSGGDDNRRRTKIIVANRVSLLDVIVLRKFISNNKCKVVCENRIE